ncbi:hypothetical protein [Acidithiobacillus caldus]|uniref:hypothetical protein n=1 Tax=Acidithiobacillus caldus TaxID=33059 RepID=UPI001D030D89|nr:hypothetical protein [Acidithiobacillus caldus]
MSKSEKRAISGLSFIYIVRMLGLFMLMSVLSLDSAQLRGGSPLLPVFAIGVYGLARAALPFPFASLQNREQHRRQPQRRVAALLCLVSASPELALRALNHPG